MPAVLVVCHANTARSVMAEVLLRQMLTARGLANAIHVRSAGVAPYARDGMLASLDARLALREVGIELAEDAMTSVDLRVHRELIVDADLILAMTREQRATVAAFPEAAGKTVLTLRELAGEDGNIDDPAGEGENAFRRARDEIQQCLETAFDRLVTMLFEPDRPPGGP
jgi:protein-tyrosine-phosphatase